MLRILYTEHKTNEEVLGMMKIKRLLIDSIRKRKAKYFGIRQNGLQRLLLEGKLNGKKGEKEGQELHGQLTSRTGLERLLANA